MQERKKKISGGKRTTSRVLKSAGKPSAKGSRPAGKPSVKGSRPAGKPPAKGSRPAGKPAGNTRNPFDEQTDKRRKPGSGFQKKDHPFEKFRTEKPVTPSRERMDKDHKQSSKSKEDYHVKNKTYREPKEIRLNRYIANSGVCSRREADDYIIAGHVKVNDQLVTEVGTKITYSDVVRFKGKRLNPEKKVYLLLNKPKDFITTVEDPYAKRTVMELVKNSCRERIYPVGRLDRLTTGLLLFTNDGELTKKLTHPSQKVIKIYQVGLDRPVERADMEEIARGIELEDGPVQVDEITWIDESDKSQVGIQLHSGRNRIIRRIFKHFDYKVIKLDRVFFAGLTKKNLPRGKWRFLDEKEVNRLKMNIFR